ncbi:MAG TPA: sulfatase [Patescibacteria group bacterium]|uniref:Sulfatase N-terminal domain-containing protein n=1 Tax=Candidatus Woesebacteria bacterium RBG_13_46_13 TaxID=1802479 RepID=A0A1F7X6K1_9BACT|nr:MAG: hypothetical protein A2Y68_00610 [Candidatus Woesebacteria bacterium RBG_13_46_13]HJX59416.1 sulfatase [Patescibacteria group bacterium]
MTFSKTSLALIVIGLSILAVFSFVLFLTKPFKGCRNCNVILVSLDTLRADSLACYGYFRDTAPNLCNFAKENVLFLNSYSNADSTLPSHFSIFTSLYPSSHGVTEILRYELSPGITPLAQFLKNNGYETVFVGQENDPSFPLDKGLGRGFDKIIYNVEDPKQWTDGLESLLENSKQNKPTFLFLHTYGIHSPYLKILKEDVFTQGSFPQLPTTKKAYFEFNETLLGYIFEDLETRISESKTPESLKRNTQLYGNLKNAASLDKAREIFEELPEYERWGIYSKRYFLSLNTQDPKQVEYLKALYDEGIYRIDQAILGTLDFLKSNNLDKNTIVIITSDHGEEFLEHGEFLHGPTLYNHTTFVPLIISVPGVKEREIQEMAQGIDIYPTIAGLLKLKTPEWLQGIDLTGLISDYPLAKKNRFVVSESYGLQYRSIRDGEWELMTNNDGKVELYNMKEDFYEKENVAEKYPVVVDELTTAMNKILAKKTVFPSVDVGFPDWLDEVKRRKLEKEGYF